MTKTTLIFAISIFGVASAFRAIFCNSHSRFRFSSLMVMTPPSSKIFRYGSDVAIAEENLVLGNWAEAEKMAREAMKIAETMDAESGNNKTASF